MNQTGMSYKPIFGTGVARSGGGLYSSCLSTHPDMMVACCPNLELFRSFRNAVIRTKGTPALRSAVPPSSALQDYYGTNERIAVLDLLLETDLDVPFDQSEWDSLHEISVARGDLESADLTPYYGRMRGTTYRDLFANLLDLIADARNARSRRWVGFHEAWALDAFPALARSFPDARFLIMLRDPRAIINSQIASGLRTPSMATHTLSYIRHWRKYVALAFRYLQSSLFRGRLHVTAHDLVVTSPRETLTGICNAFDLDLDDRMLDTNNFIDYTTGQTWKGNSSFEERTVGLSGHRAMRWRQKLAESTLNLIEYLAGPDLKLAGFPVFTRFADPAARLEPAVVRDFLEDLRVPTNWRSDLEDPLADLGLETGRRALLTVASPPEDESLIRRCFLFREQYDALRSEHRPLLRPIDSAQQEPARSM